MISTFPWYLLRSPIFGEDGSGKLTVIQNFGILDAVYITRFS